MVAGHWALHDTARAIAAARRTRNRNSAWPPSDAARSRHAVDKMSRTTRFHALAYTHAPVPSLREPSGCLARPSPRFGQGVQAVERREAIPCDRSQD